MKIGRSQTGSLDERVPKLSQTLRRRNETFQLHGK
jgi:hypothetical protein